MAQNNKISCFKAQRAQGETETTIEAEGHEEGSWPRVRYKTHTPFFEFDLPQIDKPKIHLVKKMRHTDSLRWFFSSTLINPI